MSWNVVVADTATGLISDARLGFPAINGAATLEQSTAAGSVTKYELGQAFGVAALEVATAAGTAQTGITVGVIPDLVLTIGSDPIDLVGLYVNDPLGLVTTSRIINLNATYATYTHAGGLVAVLETTTPLQNLYLEVTHD